LGNDLSHGQVVQFHSNIIKALEPVVASIVAFSIVWPRYLEAFARFKTDFKPNRQMFETQFITQKDGERDFTVRSITAKIAYYHTYAQSPEDKEDIRKLTFIAETYKRSDSKEYAAETSLLRNLIADLRKWPDLLIKFGIRELVDRLETENTDFETWYSERTVELHSKHTEGDVKSLRRATNLAFADVCKVLDGGVLTPIAADLTDKYVTAINAINSNIDEFAIIYNRHAGMLKAHKKKKEEDKNEADAGKAGLIYNKKNNNNEEKAGADGNGNGAATEGPTAGDKGPAGETAK
jgi:hypothetical protein